MRMSQETENYLFDLGREILLKAQEAQRNATKTTDSFEKGRQTAFYEVLSLMKEQAVTFGLEGKAIGIEGVDLEQLLT